MAGRITKASTALRRGREVLANNRWTRGRYRRGKTKPCFCAVGALWEPFGIFKPNGDLTDVVVPPVVDRAEYWLDRVTRDESGQYVTEYNDHGARSKKDVLAVYDKAIVLAKAAKD